MKIYPVIHVTGAESVLEQVSMVSRHDIAGVFLIDHDRDDDRLLASAAAVSRLLPDLMLGVNFIWRPFDVALELLHQAFGDRIPVAAIWTDNAGLDRIDPDAPATIGNASDREWTGLHFGGVAFKYQRDVPLEDLPALGALARKHVDVATTSGPGTGLRADPRRIRALREGLGDHPLALASGVTPENVGDYVGLVDHVLVATGIADDTDRVDEAKLAALLRNVAERLPDSSK